MSTSQLPWPASYLLAAEWIGVQRLLARCAELHASGALPGTLMVVGAAGLGREAFALELAAALVCRCLAGPGCACPSCERVRRGVHPDVEIVSVEPDKQHITIEQAQHVVQAIAHHPYEGARRVYIVDSCHTPPLGTDAASAMLKTLEEPPTHATFVLLASNPRRVLPTVASRSVLLRVPAPTLEELVPVVAAAQGCDDGRAADLLKTAAGDQALALAADGDRLPEALSAASELLAAALKGDGLSILRAGSLLRATPAGIAVAVDALLGLAERAGGEGGEGFLEAAAALLAADNRRAVLHLDLESVVVGALARAAVDAGPS